MSRLDDPGRGDPWSPLASAAIAWDIWVVGAGDAAVVASRRHARLRSLLDFVRRRSPFFRALYSHVPTDVAALSALPPTTKAALTKEFDAWVTDRSVSWAGVMDFVRDQGRIGHLHLNRYAVWKTSGTEGRPGVFLHDAHALAVYDCLMAVRGWRRFVPRSTVPGPDWRMAFIAATDSHFAGVASWQRLRREYRWLASAMHIYPVQMPLARLVENLNDLRPMQLVAYPSVLVLLAREQAAGRLDIRPTLIMCGGEHLSPSERKSIEAAFGCRVRDIYSASEFGYIAFDCDFGWLHVNADWAIVEPVDEAYRPVPLGRASHTCLLTNLANRVQPIIRYDLGDSITVRTDPCPCRSPFPAIRVEGHRNEVLHLDGSDGKAVAIVPLALTVSVEEIEGIDAWQIVQTGRRQLTLRLRTAAGVERCAAGRTVIGRLEAYLAAQGLATVEIVDSGDPPRRDEPSGKFLQVFSALAR